ncbi:hypothetical protein AGMMS49521_4050 [Campylobacterota bacterium]|nr:hypothetical protein AGMMS49521_4050 [Campylobacterota bacterium]
MLPAKRGAKYRLSKFSDTLQSKVIALRHDGFNRYEIYEALVELYNLERVSTEPIPCPSSIYNICTEGLGVVTPICYEVSALLARVTAQKQP